ncbi:MAG TPA: polysaccharide biosynthesis tyrosine autokinase [Bryobacterales bacterium]|jgi:succinoglycan biosynthesis transport protein ExoP|nr:polysaccharide biosynthesis tyrosine autokinase [Bryobacterales bacterium]
MNSSAVHDDSIGLSRPEASVWPLGAPSTASSDAGLDTLITYWRLIRRKAPFIFLCALAAVLGAWGYTAGQTPMYQAQTSLEYQPLNEAVTPFREPAAPAAPPDGAGDLAMQTEVEILQNESVLGRVADRLNLLNRPEFTAPGLVDRVRNAAGLPVAPISPRERALKMVRMRVGVWNQARLIHITYDSPDARFAAQFANTLADEFIREHQQARSETARRVGEWLSGQVAEIRTTLESLERQTQDYAQNAGLLFTGEQQQDNVAEARLRLLGNELAAAQADRIMKQSQYQAAADVPPESLPQVVGDNALRDYEVKLTDLRRELESLESLLTPSHYKVRTVQNQIAVLEAARDRELAATRKRIENEYQAALRREQLLSTRYADQSKLVSSLAAKSIHYNTLKREVETARALHASMLQKAQELSLGAAVPASNIRVLNRALPPARPYKPNYLLNLSVALFAGLFFGVGVVLLREHSDVTFKSPGQALSILQTPELAAIPKPQRGCLAGLRACLPANPHRNGQKVELAARDGAYPLLVESFHDAAASLCIRYEGAAHVITLTSPGPGEGKTTVAANLAIALAQTNRRVLLVDGDIRRPRLHKIFNLAGRPGLSDLLCDSSVLDTRAVRYAEMVRGIPNLYLLPSGPLTIAPETKEAAGISALLHSERLPELVAQLRQEFDMVIIDAPPALHGPDARLLSRAADGVILVLRAKKTSREAAVATLQRLLADNLTVLGTILNGWDPRTDSFYGYATYATRKL